MSEPIVSPFTFTFMLQIDDWISMSLDNKADVITAICPSNIDVHV